MTLKHKAKPGRPATARKNVGQVQSLSRGLNLLERISDAGAGVLLSDLAGQSGLPASTTHRLLNTLEAQGYVRREQDSELWFVGTTGFKIGNAFLANRNFVRQAKPFMQRLVEQVGETCNLSILQDAKAVIIAQEQCSEIMRMMVPVGSAAPLHASGAGKAILSALPLKEREVLVDGLSLDKITPWTMLSKQQLITALDEYSTSGWAFDDQEHAVGLRCIAACLYDEDGYPLAAISVSGPLARIDDEKAKWLGTQVKATAKLITEFVGGCWIE